MRWIVRGFVFFTYRVKTTGLGALPASGGAIVAANHVTYLDALILGALAERPIRFVVDKGFYDRPLIGAFYRFCGAIPIAGRRADPEALAAALARVDATLARGEVVGIFPEGRMTRDGELSEFRRGIEGMLARRPVPVIPVALRGLWGSFFSYAGGKPLTSWPRRFWSKIEVVAGQAIEPAQVSASGLQRTIGALMHQPLV